jgi:MFS transporter, DHA1 family, multidrug resistance protein
MLSKNPSAFHLQSLYIRAFYRYTDNVGEYLNTEYSSWKKNLYIISIAEFIGIVGFALVGPFLPLYLQQLGNLNNEEAALWAGIATGAGGLTMFISSPLWGIVADRVGRKPMLLRAQFGGSVTMILFMLAPNVIALVGCRMIQGLFTGTVSAASALVACCTPRERLPIAMGVLMGSIFAGTTIGPLLGGFLADTFGYTVTFIITSIMLLIGGLIILLFAKENFQPPTPEQKTSFTGMFRMAFSARLLPLLIVIAALNLGPQIIQPILPLIISEISTAGKAASSAGIALGLMGIITSISSFVIGRFGTRVSVRTILIICCVGSGLFYLPPVWANSTTLLIIFIGLTGLFVGGVLTASNSLISLAVPISQQGIAYGLSQSAMSLGTGLGPFIGGGLAPLIGLRPIFIVAGGVFILVGFLAMKLIPKRISRAPLEDAPVK